MSASPEGRSLRAIAEAATPGPWLLGWWSAQAERMCVREHDRKGVLLGTRPQTDYPGEGPYHIHETDFFPDTHRISGPAPACVQVAGNYDYEEGGIVHEADAAHIAAWSPDRALAALDVILAARVAVDADDALEADDAYLRLREALDRWEALNANDR